MAEEFRKTYQCSTLSRLRRLDCQTKNLCTPTHLVAFYESEHDDFAVLGRQSFECLPNFLSIFFANGNLRRTRLITRYEANQLTDGCVCRDQMLFPVHIAFRSTAVHAMSINHAFSSNFAKPWKEGYLGNC